MQTAILTGMRKGEILALTWYKIDFKNNIITIDKNLTHLNTLTLPKNLSSIRKVPLNLKLRNILLELKNKKQKKLNFTLTEDEIVLSDKPDLDFIFRNKYGSYVKSDDITYLFLNSKYHFHQFRHYFATKLINSGIPVPEVSKLLGHAQVSTTINMYVEINNQSDIKNKLDQIFGQQMDNK